MDKEIWELKTITGNGKRTLDSAIKDKKNQANIFIFDMTYSNMDTDTIIKQTIKTMKNRNWIKKIIIVKNNKLIKVFENKKEIDYDSKRN